MSYKLNQQNPERRAKILARRNKGPGTNLNTLKRNKRKEIVWPNSGRRAFTGSESLMKMSNRRACMRYLGKLVKARVKTVDEGQRLMQVIMSGRATRTMVYGFKPT